MATIAAGVTTCRRKAFAACLHKADMRLGDPILTARILQKGPNRRWGSTSVTGRLSWLEHNGHRVASPRPQHASKRHSGTYVGGSQLGSICHSAKPTTWPHRLMATAVVAVAQLPINGGLPTHPIRNGAKRRSLLRSAASGVKGGKAPLPDSRSSSQQQHGGGRQCWFRASAGQSGDAFFNKIYVIKGCCCCWLLLLTPYYLTSV